MTLVEPAENRPAFVAPPLLRLRPARDSSAGSASLVFGLGARGRPRASKVRFSLDDNRRDRGRHGLEVFGIV